MKNLKKYIFAIIVLCFCLSLQIAGRAKENIAIVTIDGKEYNIQEAENMSISMLRSGDRDKEIKAVDFLLRTPDIQLPRSKKIIDAMIDLYKKLPPLYYGFKDKNQDATQQMKIALFTMITVSSDPRGKVILEEAIKSENETMRKVGLLLKEKLLERDKEIELQKKGGKKPEPVVINPIILDVSTAKAEDLKAVLSDILVSSELKTKIESLNQLCKQVKYLNSKDGQAKRTIILKLLQNHYKIEEKPAAQGMIIGTLFEIGGEDARTFIEEVIKDKKTPRDIRKNAEIQIQMLDIDRKTMQENEILKQKILKQ